MNSSLDLNLFFYFLHPVLIPDQALAPPPPPVTSANFISEVAPVRKTTENMKGNEFWNSFQIFCNLLAEYLPSKITKDYARTDFVYWQACVHVLRMELWVVTSS